MNDLLELSNYIKDGNVLFYVSFSTYDTVEFMFLD